MLGHVAVVGAGAWGTALSTVLARLGLDVGLWAYEHEIAASINTDHVNPVYLPEVTLSDSIRAYNDIPTAISAAEFVYFSVPSQFARQIMTSVADHLADRTLVIMTKGVEHSTLLLMSELFAECKPDLDPAQLAVISGPSFAQETAANMPSAVVVASESRQTVTRIQQMFRGSNLRLYGSSDVIGVQIGGSTKNVIAIAAGMSDGLGYGHNARAALITRGSVEIARLGLAMGARRETFAGLAGIGDLVLTCTGDLSRNRTVGLRMGRGERLDAICKSMRHVAEGVSNARCFNELRSRHGIEMPITEQVYAILYDGKSPRDAVKDLMARELKPE